MSVEDEIEVLAWLVTWSPDGKEVWLQSYVSELPAIEHAKRVNGTVKPLGLIDDALRYRWVRDEHWFEPEAIFRLGLSDGDNVDKYHRDLDAAIDAKIKG